ncbi:hypothetical protein NKG94_40495 [Micromonospora sp. M12]
MAALTAYLQDVDLRKRIAGSLGLLLSQGAGVGVLVVAALQDPRRRCCRSGTCSRPGSRSA